MSFRPKYLAHVNVYVRDVEYSHAWYADLLGLHTYDYRPGKAAFMSADEDESHELALMQVGADAPLQRPGQVGLNHMAWRVESLDDLKEFYQRLKIKGVPIASVVGHGISLGIYFHDPDGHASRSITSCRARSGRDRSGFSPRIWLTEVYFPARGTRMSRPDIGPQLLEVRDDQEI